MDSARVCIRNMQGLKFVSSYQSCENRMCMIRVPEGVFEFLDGALQATGPSCLPRC
jgi:hypothetical protein